MITVFVLVFVVTLLLNWYIILFGKKDLEQLKNKISIGKYLKEIDESLVKEIGDKYTTLIKISLIVLSIVIVLTNAYLFLSGLVALILGTSVAKKSFKVGAIQNVLNKLATYINRVK